MSETGFNTFVGVITEKKIDSSGRQLTKLSDIREFENGVKIIEDFWFDGNFYGRDIGTIQIFTAYLRIGRKGIVHNNGKGIHFSNVRSVFYTARDNFYCRNRSSRKLPRLPSSWNWPRSTLHNLFA